MQENLWKVRVKGTKRKEQNHNFVRHWSIPASYQSIAPSLPSPHKSICHINFCRFSLLQTSPKSVNPCTPPPWPYCPLALLCNQTLYFRKRNLYHSRIGDPCRLAIATCPISSVFCSALFCSLYILFLRMFLDCFLRIMNTKRTQRRDRLRGKTEIWCRWW